MITFNNKHCSAFVWFLSLAWLLSWLLSGLLSWLLPRLLPWFLSWFSLRGLLPWFLSWLLSWFLAWLLGCSTWTRCSSRISTFRDSAWAPVSISPALGVLLVPGGAGVGDDSADSLAAAVPVRC